MTTKDLILIAQRNPTSLIDQPNRVLGQVFPLRNPTPDQNYRNLAQINQTLGRPMTMLDGGAPYSTAYGSMTQKKEETKESFLCKLKRSLKFVKKQKVTQRMAIPI
jgi:hypothetical protein